MHMWCFVPGLISIKRFLAAGTGTPTGAATFCFVQAIEKFGPHVTYGILLAHMDTILSPGSSSTSSMLGGLGKLGGGLLSKVLPVLSALSEYRRVVTLMAAIHSTCSDRHPCCLDQPCTMLL